MRGTGQPEDGYSDALWHLCRVDRHPGGDAGERNPHLEKALTPIIYSWTWSTKFKRGQAQAGDAAVICISQLHFNRTVPCKGH